MPVSRSIGLCRPAFAAADFKSDRNAREDEDLTTACVGRRDHRRLNLSMLARFAALHGDHQREGPVSAIEHEPVGAEVARRRHPGEHT